LMSEVYQVAPLTMEWCVSCHRAPERYLSLEPAGLAGWKRGDVVRGAALVATFDTERLTSCTTCHR